ncbi:MAG: GyrI-like domain-containing protein [Candidatus Methanogasteraceae archaeon]
MEIGIVEVQPQMVHGMRKKGKYAEIRTILSEVWQFAVERRIQIEGPSIFVFHEMTDAAAKTADAEGNADIEVAIPVSGKVEGTGEIKCYELSGGKMAKIIHRRPYQELEFVYEKLLAWLEQSGKRLVGRAREVYLKDPGKVPPEELLTEMYTLIEWFFKRR